jgi:hypothetical protein
MSHGRNRRRKDIRHAKLYGVCTRCGRPISDPRAALHLSNGEQYHWNDCALRAAFAGKYANPFHSLFVDVVWEIK